MAEFVRGTITNQKNNANQAVHNTTSRDATSYQTSEYLIYFFFGALEILLTFRFVLKLMGASSFSSFVGLIYGVTGIFIAPFQGIFHQSSTAGIETKAILEPATIISIIVYAILGIGIVKFVRILSGNLSLPNNLFIESQARNNYVWKSLIKEKRASSISFINKLYKASVFYAFWSVLSSKVV